MTIKKRKNNTSILHVTLVVAIALFVVCFFVKGYKHLGEVKTSPRSESQTVNDGKKIIAGEHRWGIVKYCHYPNGPSYILLPLLLFGVNGMSALRCLPLAIMSISLGFLLYCMVSSSKSRLVKTWSFVACITLCAQNGVLLWAGALHEHSYSFSLLWLCFACCLTISRCYPWLFLLGLVQGWIGYDLLPSFVLGTIVCRWFYHINCAQYDIKRTVIKLTAESYILVGGVMLAVGGHLVQNYLFYGNFQEAAYDLFGSALVRMGSQSGGNYAPEYANWINGLAPTLPTSSYIVSKMFHLFVIDYINPPQVMLALFIMVQILFYRFIKGEYFSEASNNKKFFLFFSVNILAVGALVSSSVWFLLMPKHAVFHYFFLPRHFLVGLTLLLMAPTLLELRPASKEVNGRQYGYSFLFIVASVSIGFIILSCVNLRLSYRASLSDFEGKSRVIASGNKIGNSQLCAPRKRKSFYSGGSGQNQSYWFSGEDSNVPYIYGYCFPSNVKLNSVKLRFWSKDIQRGCHTPMTYSIFEGRPDEGKSSVIATYPILDTAAINKVQLKESENKGFLVHEWQFNESISAQAIFLRVEKLYTFPPKGLLINDFYCDVTSDQKDPEWLSISEYKTEAIKGRVDVNAKVGEESQEKGLSLGEFVYEKGLAMTVPSHCRVNLTGKETKLKAILGLVGDMKSKNVVLRVFGDGEELFSTNISRKVIEVELQSVKKLDLVTYSDSQEAKTTKVVLADLCFLKN